MSSIGVEERSDQGMQGPNTGEENSLTGRVCSAEVRPNDFVHQNDQETKVHISCDWGGLNDNSDMSRIAQLCEVFGQERGAVCEGVKFKQMVINKLSIFVGQGHVQHAGAGWTKEHARRYQTYLIHQGCDLKDAGALRMIAL